MAGTVVTASLVDSSVSENRHFLNPRNVSRNPKKRHSNMKLDNYEVTDIATTTNGLTADHTCQRKEVLFFTNANYLFFNFKATAHCTHLLLPLTHKPTQWQKSAISQCLISAFSKIIPVL